jgi:L-2,4-diaminobutyrate decarboxylase
VPVPDAIRDAYDSERFRALGHRVIDVIAELLAGWHDRRGPALPWRDPREAREHWPRTALDERVDLAAELHRIAAASTALAHPRYLAHQVPPPLPSAALADLVSALLNNGVGVYEMGPAGVPIELAMVEWMCGVLELPAGAGGVMTSGGSLGNLTALLAMRQHATGSWREGSREPLAVVVGADAHYSVARAIQVMGWGEDGGVVAELDARHRMTREAAASAIERATARGRRVIGIVAAAGSTATGAFDPLDELADLAAAHGLWLHVDAAHGGGLAVSPRERHKLRGIARADSIVWDAHKLLMMPALVTAVLFRRSDHSYEAFAQRATYLFDDASPETRWWDLGTRTLECTKRMMAIELWCALRVHGEPWFARVVERLVDLTRAFAARISAAADFELALEPEANIICYRHLVPGATPSELDAHNRALRQRVVEDGRFYIVGTDLPGGYFLRSSIMNPLVEDHDLDALLDHLRELCRA